MIKVTNKEAYFLSLYGLIPKQFQEEMKPLLGSKFGEELQKFVYRVELDNIGLQNNEKRTCQ